MIDRRQLERPVDLVGAGRAAARRRRGARALLARAPPHPDLAPTAALPDDTRLWAALQHASGGMWGGCVYDVDRIIAVLEAGLEKLRDEKLHHEEVKR